MCARLRDPWGCRSRCCVRSTGTTGTGCWPCRAPAHPHKFTPLPVRHVRRPALVVPVQYIMPCCFVAGTGLHLGLPLEKVVQAAPEGLHRAARLGGSSSAGHDGGGVPPPDPPCGRPRATRVLPKACSSDPGCPNRLRPGKNVAERISISELFKQGFTTRCEPLLQNWKLSHSFVCTLVSEGPAGGTWGEVRFCCRDVASSRYCFVLVSLLVSLDRV